MNFAVVFINPRHNKFPSWFTIKTQLYQIHQVKDIWVLPTEYQRYLNQPWDGLMTQLETDQQDDLEQIAKSISDTYLERDHNRASLILLQSHVYSLRWDEKLKVYLYDNSALYHPISPLSIGIQEEITFDQDTQHFNFPNLISTEYDYTESFYYLLIQQEITLSNISSPSVQLQVFSAAHQAMSDLYQVQS